jgi:cytochrome c oxidase subunit I+III
MKEKVVDYPDKNQIIAFEETWQSPKGLKGFISTVNNQPLGKRFMTTAMFFFLFGGILALLIRIQLAIPDNQFVGPHFFNQLFTLHGSIMMFLFSVPFMEGLALYILPLMLGSRDVAFPRLSAFSYWTYLFGGTIFFMSFIIGEAPDSGWFSYTPLSGPKFSGLGIDFWVLGLALVEVSGIATGIELAVTILKLRARGMPLNRLPLFVWAILVITLMIVFAFTVLLMATTMLEMDRLIDTKFFNNDYGGSALLWQHLFWFFGHPEVYIMFLPATGIVSTVLATFARRPIRGYLLVALAIVITGFVSFGLWVHHMFATGLPELATAFFTAASLIIATASGIQVFAWIATIWGSRPQYKTPFLFMLGFLIIFVIGGLTGVMVAIVPFDLQVHDTYFIVAHFHYVLIGGVVFPVFGGLAYWLPKITGKMLSETLGKWSFWLTFTGFNITFFPMHFMGFLGLPRRVYTYPRSLHLGDMNMVSTIGSFILALGFLVFIFNFFRSLKKGALAGNNPWEAHSIEWTLTSPPPIYGFLTPPHYHGENGLYVEEPAPEDEIQHALNAAPVGWRATPVTSAINGEIQAIQWLPGSTYMPFMAALALSIFFIGLLLKLYLMSVVFIVFFAGLVVQWVWPNQSIEVQEDALLMEKKFGITLRPTGSKSTLWWGMLGLTIVLAMALGSFLFSYFYLWLYSAHWPQEKLPVPSMKLFLMATTLVTISWAGTYWSKREIQKDTQRFVFISLLISFFTVIGALGIYFYDLSQIPFSYTQNAYGSIFFGIYWLLISYVIVGAATILGLLVRLFTEKKIFLHPLLLQAQICSMLANFIILAALMVWVTLFLAPNIIGS